MPWVCEDIIAPCLKYIACIVLGNQKDGVAIAVGASTHHDAAFDGRGFDGDNTLLDSESGNEGLASSDDDGAWVVGVAIVPSHEFIA